MEEITHWASSVLLFQNLTIKIKFCFQKKKKVIKINNIIKQDEFPWYFNNFSLLLL